MAKNKVKKIKIKETKKITKLLKLETDIYNLEGKIVAKTELPKEIFGVKVNSKVLAQIIHVHNANKRAGTHSSKTRSSVTGSTHKIYRQKGTGRARHGDIKAPIFVGGGTAHGPHPKDYSLSIPKKMKKLSLFSALSDKFSEGRIKIIRGLDKIDVSTKFIFNALKYLGLKDETLLVLPKNINNITLSGRNIPYLKIINADILNTYEVIISKNLLMMEEAIDKIKDHFLNKKKEFISTKDNKTKVISTQKRSVKSKLKKP